MPLTKEQSEILQVIATNRNPDSVIAGGIPLARIGPRYSHCVNIFHDRASRLVQATTADIAALERAGFTVDITLVSSAPGTPTDVTFQRAEVTRGGLKTTLEWAVDSDFRYFPTIPDPDFGYVLNPVDLAINKVWAVAGRSELRDIIDLDHLTDKYLPMGPLLAAAVVVDPGFTPELLLNEMMRNTRRAPDEYEQVLGIDVPTAAKSVQSFRQKIAEARAYIDQIPTDQLGRIFQEDGRPVQPDLSRLAEYETHEPQRKGH